MHLGQASRRLGGATTVWLLLLAALTLLAFSPAIRAPFIFDDIGSVRGNPTIRQLTLGRVLHPPPLTTVSGRPVVNLSLAVDHAINEWRGVEQDRARSGPDESAQYHRTNILLHLACGLVLFGLIRRTLRAPSASEASHERADAIALAVTALWLLEPIQTAAVDYVVARTEIIASLAYCGTLYASVRAWDAQPRHRIAWYATGVAICLVGMGSKEVMATAPLAVILYDLVFRSASGRRPTRDRLAFYAALMLTAGVVVDAIVNGARSSTVGFHLGIAWYQYLYTQAWAIPHYLRLALWPSGLLLDYGQTPVTGWGGVPGLLVLCGIAIGTIWAWRRAPWVGCVGALFFLLLIPTSVVPVRLEVAAERRIYLALACPLIAAALAAEMLRARAMTRYPNAWLPGMGRWWWVPVVCAFSLITRDRSAQYLNPSGLWRSAIALNPSNARAYDNLGRLLLDQAPPDRHEADSLFALATALQPDYFIAWDDRIVLALLDSRVDSAQHLARLAIPAAERRAAEVPTADALIALADFYQTADRPADAEGALRRAVALFPARSDAATNLGTTLFRRGDAAGALDLYRKAVRADPWNAPNWALLAAAYVSLGQAEQAVAAARTATARAGRDAEPQILAGQALLILGYPTEAEAAFEVALGLNESEPRALTGLGLARAKKGQRAESISLLQRALASDSNYAPARHLLDSIGARPASR